jgi:hypothetical protein
MAACTQASSMQRTSSVAHFDNYATDNDHWPALPDALISKFVKRGEPISSHIFFELGQIFGFKRYPAANRGSDEEVISVDISWPNLRRVVLKKLRDVSATPIPSDLTPQSILTRSHLKWLLEAWGTSFDRMEGIFGNADPDEITSGLTQEQINLLWNICNERIFDLSFIHDEQSSDGKQCRQDAFETAVKSLLLTKSGAQRILSLIFAKFATENENVSPIYTPTQIRIQDGSEQWDGVSCDLSVIFDTHPSDMALALFHELSHAYSSFVISAWTYYGDSPDSKYLAAFTNYSIMNSPSVNFVREFYPMLSPAIMKPATEAIEKWMRAHLEQIFFKKRVDFTQDGDFTKITQYLPFFTNLLNGVKDFGFGNIIANDDDPLSLAAKLIYIQSIAAIFYFDANNLYESYLDGYCCTDDNRSLENTLWGMFSYDEMLTMRGVMVAKIGQRTFLLENRQNENIHTERLYQFFKTSSDQFESKLKENIDSRHYHLLSKTTMPEDVIYELRRLTHAEMCDFDELKNQLSSISIDPVVNKYVESSEDMSYIRTEYDPNFQTQILFFLANEYGTNSNVLHLNLKNLVVPSDVQSLKSQICRNLHNLKTVSFEKNSKTTHIGSCAFE